MTKMQLKIIGVTRPDLTTYRCEARNILGQQEGRISLTGMKGLSDLIYSSGSRV